jgi:hypothetical protein
MSRSVTGSQPAPALDPVLPANCAIKAHCTTGKERRITRWEYEQASACPLGDCGADVSRGPFNFWKTTPYKVVFGCASCAPQDKEKLASPSNCKIPSRVQLPPAAALRRRPHPRRRPPPFPRDSCVSWHTVNLRSAHLAPIIRTSEHFHVFSPLPRLSVRMFGSGGKKRANASSNCAAL